MENTIKAPNLSKIIQKKHINKWVAFSPDHKRILAVGNTLSEVIKRTGEKEVGVMQVLPNFGYAPLTYEV